MRKAAQITGAALIAAVLVTGCSSDKKDSKGSGSKGVIGGQTTGGSTGGTTTGGTTGGDGTVSGSYISQSGGETRSLYIQGEMAGFASKVGQSCTGKYADQTLTLTCPDGSTEFSSGKVAVADGGKSLTVTWSGGGSDTFSKLDTGSLPTGDVPTDLDVPTGDIPTGLTNSGGSAGVPG